MFERIFLASLIYRLSTSTVDGAFAGVPLDHNVKCSWKPTVRSSVYFKTSLAASDNNWSTIPGKVVGDPNPPSFSGFGRVIKNDDQKIVSSFQSGTANPTDIEVEDKTLTSSQEIIAKVGALPDFVATAKQKVILIREDLDRKEREYETMVTGLHRDIQDQEEKYNNQHKSISFQFENFKAIDAQEQLALNEEMKAREENLIEMALSQEAILAEEIQVYEQMLDLAHNEFELANNLTTAVGDQHEELMSQMQELKQKYVDDSMDWEDRLEMEQNSRQKERRMIDKSIDDLKDEHAKQMRLIRAEAQAMTEAVRSEMTNEIFLKEMKIQKSALKLKSATPSKENLVKRVTQLENERSNLPSLGRQSAKVVKKKAKNSWKRAKNFFRRGRLT